MNQKNEGKVSSQVLRLCLAASCIFVGLYMQDLKPKYETKLKVVAAFSKPFAEPMSSSEKERMNENIRSTHRKLDTIAAASFAVAGASILKFCYSFHKN